MAGRIQAELEQVTYFPAYEPCVMDPDTSTPDGGHVQRERVAQIMRFFLDSHGR